MTDLIYNCTKCGETKLDADFPYAKERRHSWCRDCHKTAKAEYRKKYRETNPRKNRIAEDYMTADGKAICSNCNEAKPLDQYTNCKGGGWCKSCRAELERNRRRDRGMKVRELSVIESDKKLCMECKVMKLLGEFSPSVRGLGGVSTYCKPCTIAKYSDKEKAKKATAKYRKVNRERHLANHRLRMFKYRSKKTATADGTVTDDFLKRLYATKVCHYCGKSTPKKKRTADHMTPLDLGGEHSAKNLVMACFSCNSSKRNVPYDEYVAKIQAKESKE